VPTRRLFRSSNISAQSELVIIVTPHLVTPVQGEALSCRPTGAHPDRAEFLNGDVAGTP
jgi:Flp pilus assembly secretin CpaC